MRASELIGRTVLDRTGSPVGRVRDLRIPLADSRGQMPARVAGIVVGGFGARASLAHAWGFAEGRASAPAVLRRLFGAELGRARYVPADAVTGWNGPVQLAGRMQDYPLLVEEVRR